MNQATCQMIERLLNRHSIEFEAKFNNKDQWSIMAKTRGQETQVEITRIWTIEQLATWVDNNKRLFP